MAYEIIINSINVALSSILLIAALFIILKIFWEEGGCVSNTGCPDIVKYFGFILTTFYPFSGPAVRKISATTVLQHLPVASLLLSDPAWP